jgi:hypothetical protein
MEREPATPEMWHEMWPRDPLETFQGILTRWGRNVKRAPGAEDRQGVKTPEERVHEFGRMRLPARLVFPGGGIFFWWQAGAITSLSKRIDLSTVPCSGASAGSAPRNS